MYSAGMAPADRISGAKRSAAAASSNWFSGSEDGPCCITTTSQFVERITPAAVPSIQ